ncbi:MAG: hypothetical protein R3174_13085, partial [Gammaproteobacteria bacterium]|nr:hypothetical protein [Gammaproteobacteria bacterium]
MQAQAFNPKSFLIALVASVAASYAVTVIVFGILWDPNGALLLERSWQDVLRIIFIGFYKCIPLGIGTFLKNHPVPVTLGLGYLSFAVIGICGRDHPVGRVVLYALAVLLTV